MRRERPCGSALPKSVMNSRRSIGFPRAEGYAGEWKNITLRLPLGGQRSEVRLGERALLQVLTNFPIGEDCKALAHSHHIPPPALSVLPHPARGR